ncbi:MAG TPA: molybdopterin-dependent oxidoreductase, partial [Spirochaetales bacterium]|nr:molybdopterin-dependent oxidoreductase [Spirochaetales bacterium]
GRFSSDQVLARRTLKLGDSELAFSVASRIVEGDFEVGSQEHWYAEPQGAFAGFDYDKLLVVCGTQWPYHVRDTVAGALGVPPAEIIVRPGPAGPHLDGRIWYPSLMAAQAALTAWLSRRNVRFVLPREEDFRVSPKRARYRASYRAALDGESNLSALEVSLALNVGAYGPLAEELVARACLGAQGVYACPNLSVKGYAVSTDTPPLGSLAGIGDAQSNFAMERIAERAAAASGADPVDWRARNLLRKGSATPTGTPFGQTWPFDALSAALRRMSDFDRKRASYGLADRAGGAEGPWRGIGIAFARQLSGAFVGGSVPNSYSVEVELDKELRLAIRSSAVPGSASVERIWRESAAAMLALDPSDVALEPPATGEAPNSGPSVLSRNVTIVASLIERACATVKRRRFREPLPIVARSTARVANPVSWTAEGAEGAPFEDAALGGAVVELELDAWSLEPRATGVWIAVAPGRLHDERHARRSLENAAVLALSQCAWERLDPSPEGLGVDAYAGYRLMPLTAVPPIGIEFILEGKRVQARGIGELPFDCVPAAFANAVALAAGIGIDTLPVEGELVAERIRAT